MKSILSIGKANAVVVAPKERIVEPDMAVLERHLRVMLETLRKRGRDAPSVIEVIADGLGDGDLRR